ncbi:MAG: hypothetical protein R3D02_15105 [Hyphomicrobiales bacterium]
MLRTTCVITSKNEGTQQERGGRTMQERTDNRVPQVWRLAGLAAIAIGAIGLVAASTLPAEAKSVCKSQAYEKKDAEDYCRPILKCEEKTPAEEMNCTGNSTARRWICKCRKPKPVSGKSKTGLSVQFGIGIVPGLGGGPAHDPGPYQGPTDHKSTLDR